MTSGQVKFYLSFARGLRPLNNDKDVLQFVEDVIGHRVMDVYVEHKVSDPHVIVDPNEIENYIDEDEVQCNGMRMRYNVLDACFLNGEKSTFERTCSNIAFPTNGPQLWPIVDHVSIYPPAMRQAIGRPKKLRNKANDEPKNPHVLSRRLATVTCKKCGEMGHNKRKLQG
ncbi:hypothetical protein KIW84_065004 [Lathyrus oleraceus]|uniref:Uncharacterized protein n=1 Tax=Pisum sativum TaxID=3888 RepID=A0A9D4WFK1_PEA|nr:hypothetical protein KIW84_065004 [Pisum sativum]